MTNSYKTGTVSVTNGSAVVNGTGTAWAIENVIGGRISIGTFEAEIIAATNTQLTLDANYVGATASGQAYRIWLQDAQAASNITINRQLGEIIARLVDSAPEIQDFLDAATAGDALTALGVSAFIKTLLDDGNQTAALATLGAASTGALAGKADVSALAGKADVSALAGKADVSALAAESVLARNASSLNTGIVPDGVMPVALRNKAFTGLADWNDCVDNGWYRSTTAANAPFAGQWYIGLVDAHDPSWITQTVYNFVSATSADTLAYRRHKQSGTWGAWYKLQLSQAEQDARYPKKPQNAAGNGQWLRLWPGDNAAFAMPSGGTWAWFAYLINSSGAVYAGFNQAGISAGGAVAMAAQGAGTTWQGFAWRISE